MKFPYHRKKLLSYGVIIFSKPFTVFTAYIRSQFLRGIFHQTPPKSINERRAEVIDGLERNWREEKRLIHKKSRSNRRTEAKQATRTAETIDGLKRNWRGEKLLIDKKSRNNRRTEVERASRRA